VESSKRVVKKKGVRILKGFAGLHKERKSLSARKIREGGRGKDIEKEVKLGDDFS